MYVNSVTISKKSINDDLIIISRKELNKLLLMAKKSTHSITDDIQKLALEVKSGKNVVGPFITTKDLFESLDL